MLDINLEGRGGKGYFEGVFGEVVLCVLVWLSYWLLNDVLIWMIVYLFVVFVIVVMCMFFVYVKY